MVTEGAIESCKRKDLYRETISRSHKVCASTSSEAAKPNILHSLLPAILPLQFFATLINKNMLKKNL